VRDIEANHGFAIAGRRVLLMGAGGAARGALLPLIERGPAAIAIANRTREKAVEIAGHFGARMRLEAGDYAGLAGREFDLVINATSASLAGAVPTLPAGVLAPGALAYDMMYGKALTPFLAWARGQGATRLADGYGMLVEQAAESFELWRGVRPATRGIIAELRAQ
jgi:shikimate dehydrogenase